jgi:hypothetical protein
MGYRFLEKQKHLPDPENLDDTHVLLGVISENDPEKIFHMMQGEQWSPHGEARALIQAKGLKHTSMSVGDVVVVNGKALIVDNTGFKELPPKDEMAFESELNESFAFTDKRKFDRYFRNEILPSVIKKYGTKDATAIRTAYNDTVDSMERNGDLPSYAVDWVVPETFLNMKPVVREAKTLQEYLSESKKKKKSKKMDNPCWDGYEPVGTKLKDGKEVPNCVPRKK